MGKPGSLPRGKTPHIPGKRPGNKQPAPYPGKNTLKTGQPRATGRQNTGKLEILYEDNAVCVISKPAGLLTIGYPGFHGKTALDILSERLLKTGRKRAAVVHRLDRDTSGVMIFALTAEAKQILMDTWQKSVVSRVYTAIVENNPAKEIPDSGSINAPLAYNKYNVAFVPKNDSPLKKNAVSAVTRFSVEQRGAKYTQLQLELETGRKNQIRAHLAYIGFPVAGDERAKTNPAGRLCLHARSITFIHPLTKKQLQFTVPEPPAWKKLCGGLPAPESEKPRQHRTAPTDRNKARRQ